MKHIVSSVCLFLLIATCSQAVEEQTIKPATFEIRTLRGVTYHNCQIVNSTPAYLTIMHDGGVARLKFELLHSEWRQKFQYDPQKAAAFLMTETEARREKMAAYKEQMAKQSRMEEQRLAELAAKQQILSSPYPPLAPFPGDVPFTTVTSSADDNIIPELPQIGASLTPGKGYGKRDRVWGVAPFWQPYPYMPAGPIIQTWTTPMPGYYHYPQQYYHYHHAHPQIWMGPPIIRIHR